MITRVLASIQEAQNKGTREMHDLQAKSPRYSSQIAAVCGRSWPYFGFYHLYPCAGTRSQLAKNLMRMQCATVINPPPSQRRTLSRPQSPPQACVVSELLRTFGPKVLRLAENRQSVENIYAAKFRFQDYLNNVPSVNAKQPVGSSCHSRLEVACRHTIH